MTVSGEGRIVYERTRVAMSGKVRAFPFVAEPSDAKWSARMFFWPGQECIGEDPSCYAQRGQAQGEGSRPLRCPGGIRGDGGRASILFSGEERSGIDGTRGVWSGIK